jgi:hypothetical protein
MYKLRDWIGQKIDGSFYEMELQLVDKELRKGYWRIEKILITRKRKGRRTRYFVKWEGYPDEFNSWTTSTKTLK